MKQKMMDGSDIRWTIFKPSFAPRFKQVATPAPHHSKFLQAGCSSWCPTNSVKALKAKRFTQEDAQKVHYSVKHKW